MVARPTSQSQARFSQPAHLLSVTEVNSQVVDEAFLNMRFESLGWAFVVPRLTPACCGHMSIMVRGGLAGCSADVMQRRSDPPKLALLVTVHQSGKIYATHIH